MRTTRAITNKAITMLVMTEFLRCASRRASASGLSWACRLIPGRIEGILWVARTRSKRQFPDTLPPPDGKSAQKSPKIGKPAPPDPTPLGGEEEENPALPYPTKAAPALGPSSGIAPSLRLIARSPVPALCQPQIAGGVTPPDSGSARPGVTRHQAPHWDHRPDRGTRRWRCPVPGPPG